MKKTILFILAVALQAHGAISIVQSSVAAVTASGANFTLSGKTLTAGSSVVIAMGLGGDIGGSGGVADSGGVNTYTASVAKEDHPFARLRSFVANNVSALASGTITYTCSSTCPGGMMMYLVEVAQVDYAVAPADTSTGTKEGAGTLSTGALSPAGNAGIVALAHNYYGADTVAAASGWTNGGTASSVDSIGVGAIATRIVAAGTYTPSFDTTGTVYSTAISMYFDEGGAAPPGTPRKRVVVIP